MSKEMIVIKDLKKSFGDLHVLKGVNLTIAEKEVVVIIGPSGSGKSTLLRCINFLEEPTGGSIVIDGIPLNGEANINEIRKEVGMVFQRFNLFPHMTVMQNLMLAPMKVRGVSKDEAEKTAHMYLKKVGMEDKANNYPDQLSGGQQQRVALARALVAQPGLLLLDEPLSNLDAKLRESMRFEILAIQKELGITVVYVTHDQGEAMAMSDRVVVMSAGVVQQIGAPHEIYTKPANKMVADFIGLVNFIDGEVKGDRVFIKGSNVSFPNTAKVTGEATIAVRPENITMSLSGGQMEGQVTHRFYLGDAVDYRVNVHGHDIRVIVKGADLDAIPDGSKVYLDFDRVMVFDRN